MPVVDSYNRITGEKTKVYSAPSVFGDVEGGAWLLHQRRDEAAHHQEMMGLQKACAKAGDREGARFFKDEAAFHRRRYNALLFVIPHFVLDPPGDCRPLTEPWYWPLDLADEFDTILMQRKM